MHSNWEFLWKLNNGSFLSKYNLENIIDLTLNICKSNYIVDTKMIKKKVKGYVSHIQIMTIYVFIFLVLVVNTFYSTSEALLR